MFELQWRGKLRQHFVQEKRKRIRKKGYRNERKKEEGRKEETKNIQMKKQKTKKKYFVKEIEDEFKR